VPSELRSNWPQILTATINANAQALVEQGEAMKFRLIGQMYAPKNGRIYHGHQASAPGQAPASDTKELEQSITVDPPEARTVASLTPPQVSVGADAPYATVLEFGGGHIAPRPNFAPIGEQMEPEVTASLTTALAASIDANSLK
jgi:hypothetical protein